MPARVLVWGPASLRTVRSVRARLPQVELCECPDVAALRAALAADVPIWLLHAGSWLADDGVAPPPSATGRPLCALGAVVAAPHTAMASEVVAWRTARDRGGDFGDRVPTELPLRSVWLATPLARALAAALPDDASDGGFAGALAQVARDQHARVVPVPSLDVHADARVRVAQVVTSLQSGGAERVAAELHSALPRHGLHSVLVPLYSPTRPELGLPEGAPPPLRLPGAASRELRRAQLDRALAAHGIDVVHAHLLDGDDLRSLAASPFGAPRVVVTVHNQQPAWPTGLLAADTTLLVGCAQRVEAELRRAGAAAPVRSVWNGIAGAGLQAQRMPRAAAREALGVDGVVLLAIANARPQKRLDRLPAIVAALAAQGVDATLLVAGASEPHDPLDAAAQRLGVAARVRRLGQVDSPTLPLCAADVLLCTSDWEGLALAWLEALACGVPVVITAVGGADELAALAPGAVTTIAAQSSETALVAEFAARTRAVLVAPRPAPCQPVTLDAMARGYARLLRWAAPRPAAHGLWLVTNNFTTGGAQSSARRLLAELRRRGVVVRAAVVEEAPAQPSPGTCDLRAQGIAVFATSPADGSDADHTTAELLAALARDPPQAVLFWNLRPDLRARLAQALFDVRVVDVSPGEMWFAALRGLFAKPRPELSLGGPRDYGARLHAAVVKYRGEAAAAAELLGAPVQVIENGVPLGPPRRDLPSEGPLRIGTLARLAPHKRLDLLLDAFALAKPRLPECVLAIAGGPERGTAEHAAALRARHPALPIEWLGDVAAGPFLESLDLFAMVSEPAGCPNASLEAMAHGLAVVATDHGGAREQVSHGETGWLVPRADLAAFADALVALGRDAPARARMGAAGRARVAARFSVARMAEAYASLLGLPLH